MAKKPAKKPQTTQPQPPEPVEAPKELEQSQDMPVEAQPEPKVEALESQTKAEAPVQPPEQTPTPSPVVLTLEYLQDEIKALLEVVSEQASVIAQVQETLARKRKPVISNGKVQIRDTLTGTVYKSKNNVYQTMLKAGDLNELVAKGVFGDLPEKNTFGVYALFRAWPDRFEEVAAEQVQEDK